MQRGYSPFFRGKVARFIRKTFLYMLFDTFILFSVNEFKFHLYIYFFDKFIIFPVNRFKFPFVFVQ